MRRLFAAVQFAVVIPSKLRDDARPQRRPDVPYLARILLYPIKAMGPILVDQARILRSGALEHDRVIGFFDADDKFVNGKRVPAIHHLRATFDPTMRTIQLTSPTSGPSTFHLDHDRPALESWLLEYFSFPVFVKENSTGGWPDDTDSPGPTLISTPTLREVCSWFPGLCVEETRTRFRTNLEIDGVEPFWEDHLYGPAGTLMRFRIGELLIDGVNPCQRCAVPPRDTRSGEGYPNFSNTFRAKREETLPPWAERSRFNHFYRLAVNTRVPLDQAGKTIHVGDTIEIIGPTT
jgi:hypothetical protein